MWEEFFKETTSEDSSGVSPEFLLLLLLQIIPGDVLPQGGGKHGGIFVLAVLHYARVDVARQQAN